MKTTTTTNNKAMSVFSLMMISVIAVDSIRSLPINAEYGFSVVFYYLLGGVMFFLPTALVSAELATGWPKTGGLYVWVREAFGSKTGFIATWIWWFYNIFWYPTILALAAAMLAYCISPQWADNKAYTVCVVLVIYWGVTWANLRGMRVSSLLVNVTAILGTLLPLIFIIIMGGIWIFSGKPLQINFSLKSFLPNLSHFGNLSLLTTVLFSLIGMELSASHAQDVKNPQRDYPRALLGSSIIILSSLIFASLAVAIVIPKKILGQALVTGTIDAFKVFLTAFHLQWLIPVVAIAIVLGAIGAVSAWVIGPAKGLLVASDDDNLPRLFQKRNQQDAPVAVLIVQALICTVISLVYFLMPSVSSAFWLLTDITAILSLLVYVFMFLAVIRLRYKYPQVKRAFTIPGGKIGVYFVAGMGLVATIFTIVLGFVPPTQIKVGSVLEYEVLLVVGVVVIGIILPLLIANRKLIGTKSND